MLIAPMSLSELAVVVPGVRDRAVKRVIDHLRTWCRALASANTNLVMGFSSPGPVSLFCSRRMTRLRNTTGSSAAAVTYGRRHQTARSGRARFVARRSAGGGVTLVLARAASAGAAVAARRERRNDPRVAVTGKRSDVG